MDILEQIRTNLEQGNQQQVHKLTGDALNTEISAETILDDGFIAAMNIIGEKFRKHEIFLPHVLLAAKAMHSGMELIKPLLEKTGRSGLGRIVIGTVKGDLHDLGKNLVAVMLKGAGFEVFDLGKNVAPEDFVDAAVLEKADIIGMSALLTTTMPVMQQVIDLLKSRDLYGKIKTMVGGAPLSEEYARDIGADAYSYDAANAVVLAKKLAGVS